MDRHYEMLRRAQPLHRTLVSDGIDETISIIVDFLKDIPNIRHEIHKFPSGSEVSTWIVPKKYVLKDFFLKEVGGRTILSKENSIPMNIPEYSQPIDKIMTFDEIKEHLFFSEKIPGAVPFKFNFFYMKNWGFCLPKNEVDMLDRTKKYHAFIDCDFVDDYLKCLEVVIDGEIEDSILIMSNICHPCQVNDSLTGMTNALMLIEHYSRNKPHYTLRFGFWSETIGAMAYFSKHQFRHKIKYALFTEMLGTDGKLRLINSMQENTKIDRVAEYVIKEKLGYVRKEVFGSEPRNDERISNGINLNISTISLSRFPYVQYHTSFDNLSIINMKRIEEVSEITKNIIDILNEDRVLVPEKNVIGQPFLTRYGIYKDFIEGKNNPNKIMENLFTFSDGKRSIFDIVEKFSYDWVMINKFADELIGAGIFAARKADYS